MDNFEGMVKVKYFTLCSPYRRAWFQSNRRRRLQADAAAAAARAHVASLQSRTAAGDAPWERSARACAPLSKDCDMNRGCFATNLKYITFSSLLKKRSA